MCERVSYPTPPRRRKGWQDQPTRGTHTIFILTSRGYLFVQLDIRLDIIRELPCIPTSVPTRLLETTLYQPRLHWDSEAVHPSTIHPFPLEC